MKERVKKLIRYEKWKRLFEKYERVLIPGTLIFGVIVDFITFRSIKIETTLLILGVYVMIAALSIVFLNRRTLESRWSLWMTKVIAPLTLQFTFGALLSASLIFYWFSGAISVSWPFLIIIAMLMASNEVFRHYYLHPVIQISVFYFILFSLLTLFFPFVFNSISVSLFISAGIVSLVAVFLFVLFLSRLFDQIRPLRFRTAAIVLSIFFLMNGFYFFNIIPPIPLSLRDASLAHSIIRSSSGYTLNVEKETWMDAILPGQTIHLRPGRPLFLYTAVFAPATLQTVLFHRWQVFDQSKHKWVDADRLSYQMRGGRDEGYRGYSMKTALRPGKWRVRVETPRGQAIGVVRFDVEEGDAESMEVIR